MIIFQSLLLQWTLQVNNRTPLSCISILRCELSIEALFILVQSQGFVLKRYYLKLSNRAYLRGQTKSMHLINNKEEWGRFMLLEECEKNNMDRKTRV